MEDQVYPAKYSKGLLAFVLLSILGPVLYGLFLGERDEFSTFFYAFMVLLSAFILYLFLNTKYIIRGSLLMIKSGFIPFKPIPISDIESIKKSRDPISSPAPSLDRILIKYSKGKSVLLSPKDEVGFAHALKAINADLIIDLKE